MGPPGCRSLGLAAAVAAVAALAAQWGALQPYATPLAELAEAQDDLQTGYPRPQIDVTPALSRSPS